MKTKREIQVTASEQKVLDGLKVRLIELKEQKRFDRLIEEHHYLHSAERVGEQRCYAVKTGRWLGTETVASKSNEIPAAQRLLERMDLDGQMAVLDALHTQVNTARQIAQDCGGDYLLTVKGNQKGIHKTLEQVWDGRKAAFSPSAANASGGPDAGA